MTTVKKPTSLDALAQTSPATAEAFQALRKSVAQSGPLDSNTCELIALGGFVTACMESGFKTHARRLLNAGLGPEALRQVLVTFAATTTLSTVAEALGWVDDLVKERG